MKKPLKTFFLSLSLIFAVGSLFYLGKITELYLNQSRYLYHPNTGPWKTTPSDLGMDFEEIEFFTADGVLLSGWWVPQKDARLAILLCKGNAGNISNMTESIRVYHKMGLSVLVFDYRGFGKSQGEPSEEGTYVDAEAAWDYLTQDKKVAPENSIIVGKSLGAAVAAHLAENHRPAGLILEGAFTSLPDIARDYYPYFPVRWFLRFEYPVAKTLGKVACPVLVIHSREDEIVPFWHGQKVYEAAQEPKMFLEISGSHNHGFLSSQDKYREGIEAFLASFIKSL